MTIALTLDRNYLAYVGSLPAGSYTIDYNDSTHLAAGEWTRLLRLNLANALEDQEDYPEEGVLGGYYTLSVELPTSVSEEDNRILVDQLAQSLVRGGILSPVLSKEMAREVFDLSKREALIVIPDTNVLANGSLHWLLQSLEKTSVWIYPIVISLTQLQQRDGLLKLLVRKRGKLRDALRARTLVNASLGLLERCGARYQVLEVDPQLLRYVRPAGRASADPDEGDVLEDRLLIEAIHSVVGATRSRTEKRVLTSDVLLARMLHAEAIPTLLLQTPILEVGKVLPSIRYEPLAEVFQGSPLPVLLWDLAHSFGTIRLCNNDTKELLRLETYWPAKTAVDWVSERLTLILPGDVGPMEAVGGQSGIGSFSKAAVPEASLLQVLRIAGAVLSGAGDIDGVLSFFANEDRPSKAIVRMALEILLRASLIEGDENSILPTVALREVDQRLAENNLDRVSAYLQAFPAYGELVALLKDSGSIPATRPTMVIRKRLFNASIDAVERLTRFPVYLGQAWTDDGQVRDGTSRPSDDQVTAAFRAAFNRHNQDRLASLSSLLPTMSRELRMSPWALRRQVQVIVERGGLSEFSFEPAAGKKALSRDQVVSGPLRALNVEPVPLDRLLISGRPVFTVERKG